jgi:hypothetical protein
VGGSDTPLAPLPPDEVEEDDTVAPVAMATAQHTAQHVTSRHGETQRDTKHCRLVVL